MTEEEIGLEASKIAKSMTIKAAEKNKVSLDQIMKRLADALDAKETKAFKTTTHNEQGGWSDEIIYSKALVAHGIRLKAVDIALRVHDAYPSERHVFEGNPDKPLKWEIEIKDARPTEPAD